MCPPCQCRDREKGEEGLLGDHWTSTLGIAEGKPTAPCSESRRVFRESQLVIKCAQKPQSAKGRLCFLCYQGDPPPQQNIWYFSSKPDVMCHTTMMVLGETTQHWKIRPCSPHESYLRYLLLQDPGQCRTLGQGGRTFMADKEQRLGENPISSGSTHPSDLSPVAKGTTTSY